MCSLFHSCDGKLDEDGKNIIAIEKTETVNLELMREDVQTEENLLGLWKYTRKQ